MARVNYQIAHLIHLDPAKARSLILDGLRAEKMHMGKTATRIGCTHGTLLIWIRKLAMNESVKKLKREAIRDAWHFEYTCGRPKMTAKERAAAKAARIAALEAMTPAQRKAREAKREARRAARAARMKKKAKSETRRAA